MKWLHSPLYLSSPEWSRCDFAYYGEQPLDGNADNSHPFKQTLYLEGQFGHMDCATDPLPS